MSEHRGGGVWESQTATLAPYHLGTSVRRLVWSRCLPGPALAPPPQLWDERLVCWPPPPPLSPHLGTPWSPAPLSRGETETRSLKIDNKDGLLFKKKKINLNFCFYAVKAVKSHWRADHWGAVFNKIKLDFFPQEALCDNSGETTDGHNNGSDLFVTSVRLRWYKETELNGIQLLRIKLINGNHIEKIS